MKTTQKIAKVVKVERKGHSVNGNPSWWVVFELMNGETFVGYTASDASCGYYVSNHLEGIAQAITYHYTKVGNLIIDFIDPISGRFAWDGIKGVKTSEAKHIALINALMLSRRVADIKVYDTFTGEIITWDDRQVEA